MTSRSTKVMAMSFGKGLWMFAGLATSIVFARQLTASELATYG